MALTKIKNSSIASDAVTTANIIADAVTAAKIADDAVGAEHIEVLDAGLVFADSAGISLGAGIDLEIYSDGTDSIIKSRAGNALGFHAATAWFRNAANNETTAKFLENGAVELYYDNAKKIETVSGGVVVTGELNCDNLYLQDSEKIHLGTSDDLQLYHDGSNSYIRDEGTGKLLIDTNGSVLQLRTTAGEEMVSCYPNAAVELYYDNVKTFETKSNGVIVQGTEGQNAELLLYADEGDDDADKWRLKVDTNGQLEISNYASGSYEKNIECNGNGNVELYYDNSKKLETTSSGIAIAGDIDVNSGGNIFCEDNGKIRIGTGEDLQIWHDGTDSFIQNGTGNLAIKAKTTEHGIIITPDGSVDLYYDGSKKFETTSGGIQVSQDILIPDDGVIRLGDASGGDLKIFHNGSHSYIRDAGTGTLRIEASEVGILNADGTETMAQFVPAGASSLRYAGSTKIATASGGVTVTGTCTATAFAGDGSALTGITVASSGIDFDDDVKAKWGTGDDLEIWHDGTGCNIRSSSLKLEIRSNDLLLQKSDAEKYFRGIADGQVELYYDNAKKLDTHSQGVNFYGSICGDDGDEVRLGTGNDMILRHNGSNSFIENSTGNLILRPKTDEEGLILRADGAAELYYDNSKKFETLSTGCAVTGELDVSGNIDLNSDSHKIKLGAGDDFQFYHDGTDNHIYTNAGNINIDVAAGDDVKIMAGGENVIWGHGNGEVNLYYDSNLKLQTTANGVDIFGTASKFQGSGEVAVYIGSTDAGGASIYFDGDSNGDWIGSDYSWIRHTTGGDMEICADNPSNDGHIYLKVASGNENSIICQANSSVELYFDTSKKFETTSTGGELTGRLAIGSTSQLVNESAITATSGGNTACFRATGAAAHSPLMCWNNHTSSDRTQIEFADGSSYTSRGKITTDGSNVTYGGTSDYRLKQDDVLITDGITKVKALKPKRFKWKDNLSIGICDGFFAHEVQETAPTSKAAIGTKDEVDSDGNPVYQSVDQAKLVPLLTAALQEAISKIETLETKVAALESS